MPEPSPGSHLARFGEFELDLRSGELRKRGVKVSLQGQPFQVLALLVQHPREVVSRDELLKEVWPAETSGDFGDRLNNVHPMFEGLRPDTRFKSLVSRMGLPGSEYPLPTIPVESRIPGGGC